MRRVLSVHPRGQDPLNKPPKPMIGWIHGDRLDQELLASVKFSGEAPSTVGRT